MLAVNQKNIRWTVTVSFFPVSRRASAFTPQPFKVVRVFFSSMASGWTIGWVGEGGGRNLVWAVSQKLCGIETSNLLVSFVGRCILLCD